MTTISLCEQYLAALNEGRLEDVLALFEPDATVVSPLYATLPVKAFFSGLFADTSRSVTTLLNVFESAQQAPVLALHFHYQWTLKDGKIVEFECVDVFELAPDREKFRKLTIIYDTAPLRADFDRSHAANVAIKDGGIPQAQP